MAFMRWHGLPDGCILTTLRAIQTFRNPRKMNDWVLWHSFKSLFIVNVKEKTE